MTDDTSLSVSRDGDAVVVTGTGELDLKRTDEMWRMIEGAIATGDRVVVDLRPALFIDTAVLSCLARAGKIMIDQNRRLEVRVKDKTHPRRALETVRFDGLMDISVE